jgi:RNA polymerase sigma-70 factor (sigma-E family)
MVTGWADISEERVMRAEEEAEFSELAAAVSHRLLCMAYAVCGDRQLAEDAVQSVWVSAYRTWPRVRDVNHTEAYLRRMVVNQLMSWRRRKSWAMTTARVVEPSRESHENGVVEQQLVWSAVGQLPRRQRAVIVLRYYEGMSEADIAETLGIRPGTVKSAASAAMVRLRATLPDTESEIETIVPACDSPKGAK